MIEARKEVTIGEVIGETTNIIIELINGVVNREIYGIVRKE